MSVTRICAWRSRWSRLRGFVTRLAVAAGAVTAALLGCTTPATACPAEHTCVQARPHHPAAAPANPPASSVPARAPLPAADHADAPQHTTPASEVPAAIATIAEPSSAPPVAAPQHVHDAAALVTQFPHRGPVMPRAPPA